MRILFLDDSVAFDGATPESQALGGAEKAVVGLAGALARRGHTVTVANRCARAVTHGGVQWQPLDDGLPTDVDAVIAVRRASLLVDAPVVRHRVLWVMGPVETLDDPFAARVLEALTPSLLFVSDAQRVAYRGPLRTLVVAPAVNKAFAPREDGTVPPDADRPLAITTVHPRHGLDALLEQWQAVIHPAAPTARLRIYSGLLSRIEVDKVPEDLRPLHAKAYAAASDGVEVCAPTGDIGMADAYRAARVFLYPGQTADMACWTLAESQACGLPAVAFDRGAAIERIANGQSGFVVPDDDAFANVAVQLLTNDAVQAAQAEVAGSFHRRRTWNMAAAEAEALFRVDPRTSGSGGVAG